MTVPFRDHDVLCADIRRSRPLPRDRPGRTTGPVVGRTHVATTEAASPSQLEPVHVLA